MVTYRGFVCLCVINAKLRLLTYTMNMIVDLCSSDSDVALVRPTNPHSEVFFFVFFRHPLTAK